jgi:ketosteroid isomerase-like protein
MDPRTSEHIELAKQALSHFETDYSDRFDGGFKPLFDSLADDAVFHVPCPPDTPRYGQPAVGKQAVIELFLSDEGIFEEVELERPLELIGAGERVVVLFALRYRIVQTGALHRNKEVALVIDFRDRKIVKMTEIQDMSPWYVTSRNDHQGK